MEENVLPLTICGTTYLLTATTMRTNTVIEAQTANRKWKEIYPTINTRWHHLNSNTSLVGWPEIKCWTKFTTKTFIYNKYQQFPI